MESLKSKLLTYYGLKEEDYESYTAEPTYSLIPTIEGELSVLEAKKTLFAAIKAKQSIIVYGDYDTDGIMATSIIVRTLALMGVDAKHFIPSRYIDGYGLNKENAKKIVESGFGLAILVDNGVSCFEEVAYLRQNNVNVIIIDHHDLPASLPPANAIVHDELLKYGECSVSAGFLSYLFSRVLLNRNDPYLFTLGSLSLLSDVMPMKAQNRAAVGLMLREIREHEFPEIVWLTNKKYIDEKILGIEVIPKINSVPRLKEGHEANNLVKYFANLEGKDKFKLAEQLREINEERKTVANDGFETIYLDDSPGFCVKGDSPEGLNGLIANKILDKKNVPVLVFSPSKASKGCLVGSFRSKEGADFPSLIEELGDLPIKNGGHAYAGGITIKEEDFKRVNELFLSWASRHPLLKAKEDTKPIEIDIGEATLDTYIEIRKFGPFGEGHPEPTFLLKDVEVGALRILKDEKPFKAIPNRGKVTIKSFKFAKEALINDKISLKGTFGINEFKERRTFEFTCEIEKEDN